MTWQPLGPEGCERLADAGLSATDADEAEVVVRRSAEGVTRFANSEIHQNVWRDDIAVTLRMVLDGGRAGVVTVHTDDPAEVAFAAQQAVTLAALAPPDPAYGGLAPAQKVPSVPYDEATAHSDPDARATAVAAVIGEAASDMTAAGAYRTTGRETGVYTSAGQRVYAPTSSAALTVVVMTDTSSGWAEGCGRSTSVVDAAGCGLQAARKADAGRQAIDVDAGTWTVVLEPPAVATMMQFLGYLGFGGRAWLEGRAFTSGRLGEQVVDPMITLVDDATSDAATGRPFDDEGTHKQRVELLRAGVAQAVVHDRRTGAQAGVASTGHGLPAPNTFGGLVQDPILLPGDGGSVDDVVAGCERGLLVTRFHYTNVVHPKETTITGMTRDGTFLIADGRITSAVRNLRFTQSILAALSTVQAVSTETRFATEIFNDGSLFPALRLPAFTFSGVTSFG